MTEPMHYPDYPDICGSIRSMANAVSGLGVVTKPASQIRIEKRLWEIADALEKRYKEDRARGPVQQAPAAHYCTHLKWLTQIEGDGDYRCELGNKTSCEWCEGKSRCGDYQSVHDAALITQEREKWERERAQAPIGDCHYCDRCIEAERKQAREDVLKRLHLVVPLCDALIEKFDCQSQLGFNALLIKRELESLRSEARK